MSEHQKSKVRDNRGDNHHTQQASKSTDTHLEDQMRHGGLQPVAREFFITAEKGGVARAKVEGEKEKECTTECKSRQRRVEKAPCALNYGSGERESVEKGRRRGGEKRAMHV